MLYRFLSFALLGRAIFLALSGRPLALITRLGMGALRRAPQPYGLRPRSRQVQRRSTPPPAVNPLYRKRIAKRF